MKLAFYLVNELLQVQLNELPFCQSQLHVG
jgi:hypothetical protein